MSINLLEIICERMGYPALQKIDPNTQKVAADKQSSPAHLFEQAAIPAILAGLYKYVQSDEGATELLRGNNSPNWVSRIFGDNKKGVIEKISGYTSGTGNDPETAMNLVAAESVIVVKENLPKDAGINDVRLFFSTQINQILLYLPAELQMGVLLQEETLDDKTNKMEGPISSLVQNLGALFSGPVTDKKDQ